MEMAELINGVKNQRDWVLEINNLSRIIEKLNNAGKVSSVRELSNVVSKSKSWVGVSLILLKGLKLYPEIEKFNNRNKAYLYVQRKQKFRKFLES